MKASTQLGVTILTILILAGILSTFATAATLPNILPEAIPESLLGSSRSGTSTFGSGLLEIKSLSSTGIQGELNSLKTGPFTVEFEEVEDVTLGAKCLGLSDTVSNAVSVAGTFHIRDYKAGAMLAVAAVFLLPPTHFSCSTILVVTSGCVAGAVTPENTLTKTVTVTFAKTGSDNQIITVLNEENTANELCQLLAKEGTGATKLSAFVSKVEVGEIKKGTGTAGLEVLAMAL